MQKRAGRSVWYDRRVRNAEAAGSNPARSTKNQSFRYIVNQKNIFKLEEETLRLLLLLPKLFADGCFFGSASSLGCMLVVASVQAILG